MRAVVLGPFVHAEVPLRLPLFLARVSAGFPSPADDYVDRDLSLNSCTGRSNGYAVLYASSYFVLRGMAVEVGGHGGAAHGDDDSPVTTATEAKPYRR